MNSSGKFLSPIVTAGLPAPVPVAALVAVVAVLVEEDLLLLPHAASARASIATSAAAVVWRNRFMVCLPGSMCMREALWRHARGAEPGRRGLAGPCARQAQPARGERPL